MYAENLLMLNLEGTTVYICSIALDLACNIYILLHDWKGNTGEYSVRGWKYWPERSEGQYRS